MYFLRHSPKNDQNLRPNQNESYMKQKKKISNLNDFNHNISKNMKVKILMVQANINIISHLLKGNIAKPEQCSVS